jgi:chemotaxis methyl-accepting protein methylase
MFNSNHFRGFTPTATCCRRFAAELRNYKTYASGDRGSKPTKSDFEHTSNQLPTIDYQLMQTATPTAPAQRLTANEFALWQDFVREHCGTHFTTSRQHFLEARLRERMLALNFQSFTEYFNHLQHSDPHSSEWQRLQIVLLNHESSFFRHQPSFDALAKQVLPELRDRKLESGEQSINIWSAGCAGGQEIYSLAMQLAECGFIRPDHTTNAPATNAFANAVSPGDVNWQVQLLATDLDQQILQQTVTGSYRPFELRGLDDRYRLRYFDATTDDTFQVKQSLRQRMKTDQFDLLTSHGSNLPSQDVIFCQNVLIYFRQ